MAGQGKYTKFAPVANAKNTLLAKLFQGSSKAENPYAALVGKENEARAQAIEAAKQYVVPASQTGDLNIFPNGVNLDYSGDPNGITAPDTKEGGDVKWQKAGDPANPFTPDLRSPGPGSTDAPSADNLQTDPNISVADVQGAGYVPGAPGTGTKSPAKSGPEVYDNAQLGKTQKLGDSGANS